MKISGENINQSINQSFRDKDKKIELVKIIGGSKAIDIRVKVILTDFV
jgi:hypothetical protein